MRAPNRIQLHAAPLISLALVAGIWADRQLFHMPVGNAREYHARVFAVAGQIPFRIGEWVGTEVETPSSALKLLRPNVILGRRYRSSSSGEYATLMIVQCKDARDMSGHYPPICYPSNGWIPRGELRRDLHVKGTTIPVTIYRFTIESIDRYSEIVVYNFFARPDGSIESGQDGVRKAAGDPRLKVFGAGQIQVEFGPSMPDTRRDEVFRTLIAGILPIIEVIRDGAKK